VALRRPGRRAPGSHPASGKRTHPPWQAASGRERGKVLGASGSPGAGGGRAVGAEDAAAVGGRAAQVPLAHTWGAYLPCRAFVS